MKKSLNCSYQLVWSEVQRTFIVVSELTRVKGKSVSGVIRLTLAAGSTIASFAALASGPAIPPSLSDNDIQSVATDTNRSVVVRDGDVHLVHDGGQAAGTVLHKGGLQHIRPGGNASDSTIFGGASQVVAGIASGASVSDGGEQLVQQSGSAAGTIINDKGTQTVGGSASATVINGGGVQRVHDGGLASGSTLHQGGLQHIDAGGSASDSIIFGGASQVVAGTASGASVSDGGEQLVQQSGSAVATIINDKGMQTVDGSALSTTINNNGTQLVNSGGQTAGSVIHQGGLQHVSSGGTARDTTIFGGGKQLVEGSASGASLSDGGVQQVKKSGQAWGSLINDGGVQRVDGQAFLAVVNGGGLQLIEPYGRSDGTVINQGGTQILNNSAVAVATIMNGGEQHVNSGTQAFDTRVLGGTQNIGYGGKATDSRIEKGGVQNVNSGGVNSFGIVQQGGTQNVNADGLADITLIDGGLQVLAGTATGNAVINGGRQWVQAGGQALMSQVGDGGVQDVSGTATQTRIADGGEQRVNRNADVTGTVIETGGFQTINRAALVRDTRILGGTQNLLEGASATDTLMDNFAVQNIAAGAHADATSLINGSEQNVRGLAHSTELSSGAVQQVYDGGTATSTTLYQRGVQNIHNGGESLDAVASRGGVQNILPGGAATSTTIKEGGTQNVGNGGTANSTLVNAGGIQNVSAGGIIINNAVPAASGGARAIGTTVTEGGTQYVHRGGIADLTHIERGGRMALDSGALATNIQLGSGAALVAGTDSTLNGTHTLGSFSIQDKVASGLLLENGGLLTVTADGLAADTVVSDGGTLSVEQGGALSGVTRLNDGATLAGNVNNQHELHITTESGANTITASINGDGSLYKQGSNTLTLSGELRQGGGTWLQNGTLVFSGLTAVTDIIARAGTALRLTDGSTLTGMIDPTDLTVDGGSTWLMTGDSLLADLTLGGTIDYQAPEGAFTPKMLTVNNLAGNNGTVILNTLFQDGAAVTDSLVLDGGNATGNTRIAIRPQGQLGARTTGNGIQVVNAINGATTAADAFSLSNNLQAGAYNYTLEKGGADESWYLTTAVAGGSDDGPQNYRPAMYLYSSLYAQAMDYDSALLGSQDARRYAARSATEGDSNLWARFQAGQLSHDHGGSDLRRGNTPDSKGGYTFVQIGSDLWQASASAMSWNAGIYGAAGLSAIDVQRNDKSKAGTVRDDAYSAAFYLNGVHDSGWWMDIVAQGTRHNFDSRPRDGEGMKTRGWGYIGSFETGMPYSIGGGLVLEPQLQYQYRGVNLRNGDDDAADIKFGDGRSQQVRAGLRLGNDATLKATGKPVPVSWWVRPSFIQTFDSKGEVNVSVPGVAGSEVAFRPDRDGSAVAFDIGIDGQIRDNVTLGARAGYTRTVDDAGTGGYGGQVTLKVAF